MKSIPANFSVPIKLETSKLRLRMLTVNDVVKDYDAVMSSTDHLQGVFGPGSKWPTKDLTFEQDLIDLGWHQKEFQNRSSFAYTVMSLDERECLGCVYIYPLENKKHDAKVLLWVRASEADTGLDKHLFDVVSKWISEKWPFTKVGYPGRPIDWKTWNSQG